MAKEDKESGEEKTQENRRFELSKTKMTLYWGAAITGAFTILNLWKSLFEVISIWAFAGAAILVSFFSYLGLRHKRILEELSSDRRIRMNAEESESLEPLFERFADFVEEFKKFISPINEHSIYNLIKRMNKIIGNQEIFPENYIERHWRDTDNRLYRINNRIIRSDIRKKEILLLIDEFLDIVESYTKFCEDFKVFVKECKVTLPEDIFEQYMTLIREEYNDFFIRIRELAKETYRNFGEKKEIPNLKLPYLWLKEG